MDEKTADKRSSETLMKNLSKKTKTVDYNTYFIENKSAESRNQSQTREVPLSVEEHKQSSPRSSSDIITERTAEEVTLSYKQLSEMVSDMFTMAHVMMEELKDATAKIHSYRTNSMLAISNTDVLHPVGDPMLEMFEKYELPINTKEELEKLESDLNGSQNFLKFFVSSFCCRNTQTSLL